MPKQPTVGKIKHYSSELVSCSAWCQIILIRTGMAAVSQRLGIEDHQRQSSEVENILGSNLCSMPVFLNIFSQSLYQWQTTRRSHGRQWLALIFVTFSPPLTPLTPTLQLLPLPYFFICRHICVEDQVLSHRVTLIAPTPECFGGSTEVTCNWKTHCCFSGTCLWCVLAGIQENDTDQWVKPILEEPTQVVN